MRSHSITSSLLVLAAIAGPLTAQVTDPLSDVEPASPVHLVLSEDVVAELGMLADTLKVETVRCLVGVLKGGSAVIDLVWEPPIDRTTPNRLVYRRCPMATVALWHNHPPRKRAAPEHACYLSRSDIAEALSARAPPIQIVQVTSGVACWWTRSQVNLVGESDKLLPFPGQRRGNPSPTSPTCRHAPIRLLTCVMLHLEEREDVWQQETDPFAKPFRRPANAGKQWPVVVNRSS